MGLLCYIWDYCAPGQNVINYVAPDESPPVMSDRGCQDVLLVTMGLSRV